MQPPRTITIHIQCIKREWVGEMECECHITLHTIPTTHSPPHPNSGVRCEYIYTHINPLYCTLWSININRERERPHVQSARTATTLRICLRMQPAMTATAQRICLRMQPGRNATVTNALVSATAQAAARSLPWRRLKAGCRRSQRQCRARRCS